MHLPTPRSATPRRSARAIGLIACLAAAAAARAADPPPDAPPSELDALDLADSTPQAEQRKDTGWRLFGELAVGKATRTEPGDGGATRRASIDLRYDGRPIEGLRAVLSNRLDLADRSGRPAHDVNTLREAYLSWAWTSTRTLDFGRVNVRHGVATGFNPTDFFKAHALRSVVSPDPAALRENRQGTVVLQGQQLWTTGSLTALVSPDLGRGPTADAYSLDLGATNPRDRWQLVLGQRLAEGLDPQLLLHGGSGVPVQLGLNLALALGDSTVAFAELAAGDGRSLRSEALGLPEARSSQQRAAVGLTYTTSFNLSVTAEAEASSAGLTPGQWSALTPGERLAVLAAADAWQDLPSRRAWFLYAQWKDLGRPGLDMAAYVRRESTTGSHDQWLEMRYRWGEQDLSLQWQQFDGGPQSLYGAVPQRRAVEMVFRHFF